MNTPYLTPDHPDAFIDHEWTAPAPDGRRTVICPVCKGHGGWNLRLNAYREHYERDIIGTQGLPDTPENRHLHCHFRCVCSHCDGWGWVSADETCTGHEWKHTANLGNCLNEYTCTKCGAKQVWDSSD